MPFSSSVFMISSSNDPSIKYQWVLGSNNSLELEKKTLTGEVETSRKIAKFEIDDDEPENTDAQLTFNPRKGVKTVSSSNEAGISKIDATIEPANDAIYNVGTELSRFADGYFAGTIACSNMTIGGTPLSSFAVGVADGTITADKLAS
jgi:hypothetical protein